MYEFPSSLDHTNNPDVKEAMIEQMNFWAESLPHHELQDFGNTINITRIDYLPSCILRFSSQYESRLVRQKRRAHANEDIPEKTVFSEADIDRWNMSLYSHDGFAEGEHEFTVSGSEEVIQCGTCSGIGNVECGHCEGVGRSVCSSCHGDGKIRCKSCSGKGKTTCSSCSGNGKKTCSLCGGRGQRQQTRYVETGSDFDRTVPVQVWENCASCHGSGHHTCSTCGGRKTVDCRTCGSTGMIVCNTCKGQGEIVCAHCRGEGRLTCSSCHGSGAEVEYFTVTQRFSPVTSTLNLHENEILERFPDFSPDFDDADDEMIVHLDADLLSREDLDDSPVESSYRKFFDEHGSNAPVGEIGTTAFIRQQQVLVGNVNVI
ncbi:MAG: hypothetical protein GF372_00930, partial [Candidatus Marinimicrobia bacterium]|nr:hypothetical protein [Candidatus Neomarinimicrobiota bacterium]